MDEAAELLLQSGVVDDQDVAHADISVQDPAHGHGGAMTCSCSETEASQSAGFHGIKNEA